MVCPSLGQQTLISSSHELEGFAFIPNALLDSILLVGCGGEWMMIKAETLKSQSKSMAIMASYYASTFKNQNVFLMGKVEINN